MHGDLFDDPVTGDLLDRIEGATCLWGPDQEGRRKQPDPVQVVADLCHHVNRDSNSKRLAITLGANRAPIDAVRAIQNASSGRTGWTIAEHLHRRGHDVIVIAGKTSADPSFRLPDVRRAGGPDAMLNTCLKVADSRPDGWVHAAAVLDYYAEAESGKKASGAEEWVLTLGPGPKHIHELAPHVGDAKRIGFKLETGVSHAELEQAALNQIEQYGVDATIANLMEEMHDPSTPRAYLVTQDGSMVVAGAGGRVYNFDDGTYTDDGESYTTEYQTSWLQLSEPRDNIKIKQGNYIKPIFDAGAPVSYEVRAEGDFAVNSGETITIDVSGGSDPIALATIPYTIGGSSIQNVKHALRWRGEQVRITFKTDDAQGPDVVSQFTLYANMFGTR